MFYPNFWKLSWRTTNILSISSIVNFIPYLSDFFRIIIDLWFLPNNQFSKYNLAFVIQIRTTFELKWSWLFLCPLVFEVTQFILYICEFDNLRTIDQTFCRILICVFHSELDSGYDITILTYRGLHGIFIASLRMYKVSHC